MKKLLFILGIILFLLGFLYVKGQNSLVEYARTVPVHYGEMIWHYHINGEVLGKQTTQYFIGSIVAVMKESSEHLQTGDAVLSYQNVNGKTVTLKAEQSGHLLGITDNHITIIEEDYHIECYLPYEIEQYLQVGQQASFQLNGVYYLAQIEELDTIGSWQENRYVYKVKLKTEQPLQYHQQVALSFSLEKMTGMLTEREALLEKDGRYYLFDAAGLADIHNHQNYLIEIELMMADGDQILFYAPISESTIVAILDDSLKEVLIDDSD